MTANELADCLDEFYKKYVPNDAFEESANMLRQFGLAESIIKQQQLEIKDLKQQVAFLEDWRDTWSPFLKAITEKVNEK
jgi:hypothetical protein